MIKNSEKNLPKERKRRKSMTKIAKRIKMKLMRTLSKSRMTKMKGNLKI